MPTVTGDNFYIDKHTLQFRTGESSIASIAYDKTQEEISISNAGTGSINIGDAGGDIFIGDGSIETDIVSTSKFGKNCLFNLFIDKKPANNIKNIIMLAAVLCFTKKAKIEDWGNLIKFYSF